MASRDHIGQTICDLVGNTPMVYLNKVTEGCVAKIAVKVEWMNPAGSVKDRIGIAMVEEAERQGKIKPGLSTIIEPTSGNTGIALAFVSVAKGYRFIATMPSTMSGERARWNIGSRSLGKNDDWLVKEERTLLRAFGADLVLTDPAFGIKGCVERAEQLAARIPNSFIPMQFANEANPEIHYRTTGPEIWRQTHGKVDVCVFGIGTGGTLTGAGRYLREQNPSIKFFAVEPVESPVLSGGEPSAHKIQGMGAGIVPPILDTKMYEEIILVHSDDAIAMSKRLAREEGLLSGISSGANVVAALRIAQRPEMAGKLIVTALPSSGERYLSSALYSDIRQEMESMSHMETLEENMKRLKLDQTMNQLFCNT